MTKKEIVKKIAERAELTQLQTKEIVQWTFDAIIETLVAEGRIELRNFGVFEVKRRKARRARNPRTNQPVNVDEKFVVTFQPGKVMEEKVRKHNPPEIKRKPRKATRASEVEEEEEVAEMLVGAGVGAEGGTGGMESEHQSDTSNSNPHKSH